MSTDRNIQVLCNCGRRFVLTAGQQEWFEQKGMALPKRCEECRKKKNDPDALEEKRRNSPFAPLLASMPVRQARKWKGSNATV